MTKLNALLASPIGWLFAHTLALPFGAILIWPGSRTAFLPQIIPHGYVKRTAAMLVLRPQTLLANWADIGCLDSFLTQQAARYDRLVAPTIALAGDRDPLVPLEQHAAKLAATAPAVKVEVVPGFGHMLHHAAADRVAAAVEELSSAAQAADRDQRDGEVSDLSAPLFASGIYTSVIARPPTKATLIMFVVPGVPSGTPATTMTRWPALAKPSLNAI